MDMSIKSRLKYIATLPLFLLAVVAAQFAHVIPASAAALTWTGAGDGVKFSDATNWSTGQVPVTGDTLTFPGIAGTTSATLQNDLTNVTFAGMQVSPTANSTSSSTFYTIDKLVFSDGASITQGVYPSGSYVGASVGVTDLVANGNLSVETYLQSSKYTVAGNLTLKSSANFSAGSVVTGKIIVQSSVSVSKNVTAAQYELTGSYPALIVDGSYTDAFTTPVSVASGATNARIQFYASSTWDSSTHTTTYQAKDYTFGSPITLNANLAVAVYKEVTARLSGQITSNNFTLSKAIGSDGKLFIGDTELIPETKTTTISDNKVNDSVEVAQNETTILDGKRSYVSVYFGGTLKGVGIARYIGVQDGAVIAPGHSPGTITSTEQLYIDGEYQAEILNKDSYDKIVAGEDYSGSSNAVILDSTAHLTVILPADYSINQGEQFTIIDNKSSTDVDGIFADLPEGAQFTINNVVFSITYKGGDGNDVVLTALNTGKDVGTPNTGAQKLSLANPALVAGLGIGTAVLLVAIALTRRKTTK
jgi:fibronectin-binding autotransporter adhesin